MAIQLYSLTYRALMETDPKKKCQLASALYVAWQEGRCSKAPLRVHRIDIPGRPEKPVLVQPKYLVKRKINTKEGIAALLHAIAHKIGRAHV